MSSNRKPNPTRIRDNQRRSRARQKEYLHELESKLQNFERLGVTASLEIQAAARNVLEENKRLRRLLRSAGIAYSENPPVDDGTSNCEQKTSQAEVLEHKLAGYRPREENMAGLTINERLSPRFPYAPSPPSPCLKSSKSRQQCAVVEPEAAMIPALVPPAESNRAMEPLSASSEQPNTIKSGIDLAESSANTCSCASAASIIMNMRADLGAHDVNKAIGCYDPSPGCTVDTATVFTAVDRFMG